MAPEPSTSGYRVSKQRGARSQARASDGDALRQDTQRGALAGSTFQANFIFRSRSVACYLPAT